MRWLLLGYIYLFIHRPFEIWPSLGSFRIELAYMLMTGMFWLMSGQKRWIPDRMHFAFIAFAVIVVFSWVLSPWNHIDRPDMLDYLKIFPCYLLFVTVLHDEKHLHHVLLGFLFVMTIYMGHSLAEYIGGRYHFRMNTVRLMGIDLSLGDPNHFAHSIVYSLPFLVPTWTRTRSFWLRGFLCGYFALSCACVALTGSRSAFVGILLGVAIIIWRSKWRWPMAAVAILASPMLWTAMPENLQKRFETIIDPSVGPKNAKESADGRWEGLLLGLKTWEKYPLSGCGPGFWIPETKRKVQSHNLYGQVLGETGTLGVLAFATILAFFGWKLYWIQREYKRHPEWGRDYVYQVVKAVGLAILLMLVLGHSLHTLLRFNWVWYGAFLIVCQHFVRQRCQAAAEGSTVFIPAYGRLAPGSC